MMAGPAEIAALRGLWAAVAIEVTADFREQARRFAARPEVVERIAAECRSYWTGRDGRAVLSMAGYEPTAAMAEAMLASAMDLGLSSRLQKRSAVGGHTKIDAEELRRLAAEGATYRSAADHFNATPNGIRDACARHGVELRRSQPRGTT